MTPYWNQKKHESTKQNEEYKTRLKQAYNLVSDRDVQSME